MLPGLQELYLQLTYAGNKKKSFITARNTNSIPKLIKLQNSVAKCCKIRKIYSRASLRIFYIITHFILFAILIG